MSGKTIQRNPSVPAAEPASNAPSEPASNAPSEPASNAPSEPASNAPSEPGENIGPVPYARFKAVIDERNRLRAEQDARQQAETAGASVLEQQFAQLRQELDAMKQQAEAARRDAIRAQVGAEFKLPAALLGRLQGDNEEALRADAQALMVAIQAATGVQPAAPKATPTPAPLPTSTGNPGGGMRVTLDQLNAMTPQQVAALDFSVVKEVIEGSKS